MNYLTMTREDMALQQKLLDEYSAVLSKLPPGRLCKKTIKGRNYYYYALPGEKKQVLIKKDNEKLIYDLKYKRYIQEAIRRFETNLDFQDRLLKEYRPYHSAAIEQALPASYRNPPVPFSPPAEPGEEDDDFFQEGRDKRTSFGLYVRSKSEALIAELLHAAKIPFIYEKKLLLRSIHGGSITYRPDFTFEPFQSQYVYWEHMGVFDSESYRAKSYDKLIDYHHNFIYPPDNLILTMDGPNGSIDLAAINRVINGQLLPLFSQ